ncbi:MAG: hypothetical protein JOZ62_20960 [Acidobacteriaceae bacterium]|nr:hypothetical protein [Acidobacteriaceae bacterium]
MRLGPHVLRHPKLPVPGCAKVRIAQLSATATFDGVGLFPPPRWKDLQAYAPNVLVGSAAELQRLVERMDLRTVDLTTVDHSIFIVTQLGDKPVTDVFRVVLWQRFGVPVFELYTDAAGTLLARECEAQDGWHVEPGVRFSAYKRQLVLHAGDTAIRTGLTRYLENQPCPCGRSGLRIMAIEPSVVEETESLLAATA